MSVLQINHRLMLSIIGIKKTIKQHTADMDITDSVDYKISAPPNDLIVT
jgi:hypothetical protein